MFKSLISLAASALLVTACVSVATPTAAPSVAAPTPTFGVTTPAPPTATPAPTATPTPTPTLAPTATPEPTPTLEPSLEPSPSATSSATTSDLIFDDTMEDPTSGWDELDDSAFASVTYELGALAFRINDDGSWAYTVRPLVMPQRVLRPVAIFDTDGDALFGPLCGAGDGVYYGALLSTQDELLFVSINADGVEVLDRQDLGIDVPDSGASTMGIQCTGMADGTLRIEALLQGAGPIGIYEEADAGGPAEFSYMGLYVEAIGDNRTVIVDEAAAFGLSAAEAMSTEAFEILSHVKSDWQSTCEESPVPPLFNENATAHVICVLQTGGDGPEIVEYASFATAADLDDAFQQRVDEFADDVDVGTCHDGPHQDTWSLGDDTLGDVLCAPQGVGLRFDWTDTRFNILASLLDFDAEGDYSLTYEEWTGAALL